jgi:ribosomal protein S18 acetylase RimI-like enzyme
MMEIWVRDCFEKGTVLTARQEEKIVGVAVLQSPEDEEIEIINKEDFAYDRLEKVAGADNIEKFIHMCEVSDADCHKLPIPKWHLVLLAISNKCNGQGIGSIMLQKCIIPYLKEHNAKLITFNTNAEINRRFYIKNGFEEFAVEYLIENGIRMGNWSYKMSISD